VAKTYRGEMRIVEDDLSGEAIRALLQIHFDGMLANSPPGSCHFLDLDELRGPGVPDPAYRSERTLWRDSKRSGDGARQHGRVTFWSIWDDDELAGCGAIKELAPTHGEIKSMRTAEAHLGKHVGSEMLAHIVDVARQRGYQRLSLETGSTDAFAAAIRLYKRFDFVACEPFGDYKPDPFSRFFTLVL
jgi:putative acetyltransferase